jgi:hypothetical protein
VLTAVVLSTIGVLIGLMVMGQSFGVVMTGIGVIANAGVIVNNNIVLIDTYDRLRRDGKEAYEAILETCRERARPVVLTAMTAILGVLPIAFGVNVEFLSREMAGADCRRAKSWRVSRANPRVRVSEGGCIRQSQTAEQLRPMPQQRIRCLQPSQHLDVARRTPGSEMAVRYTQEDGL